MDIKILEDVGLTKSEIKVYLALLELGSSATGKIIDKSKVSSSKIYEILNRLIQKGLVGFIIKSGVKYFEAAAPERIMDYMEEKEKKFDKQKQELKSIIPKLELKRKLSKYKSEATIFKGIEGTKTAFDDVLKTMKKGEEYYVMGATEPSALFSRFIRHYHKRRAKQGIKVKLLFSEQGREWAKNIRDIPLTKIKFAPSQLLSSSFVLIYKNKTLITVSTKEDITLFRIESKEVADSFKSQFELLWSQEVNTYKRSEGIKIAFQNLVDELNPGEEVHIMGVHDFGDEFMPLALFFQKIRSKKGIKAKFLMNKKAKKIAEKFSKYLPLEIRFMPEGVFTPAIFIIYKDKVIINLAKEQTFFVIPSKSTALAFEAYFKLMWKTAKS